MSVQNASNLNNTPFILSGESFAKDSEILKQDAARAAIFYPFTVLGKRQVVSAITPVAGANTGNGTCTAATVVGIDSIGQRVVPQSGSWLFILTAALVGKLQDPSGNDVITGIALNDGTTTVIKYAGLQFTITDGATPFAADDQFSLPVVADGDLIPLDDSDVLGAAEVYGIYLGDQIAAADIVAADIPSIPVLVGGNCTVASDKIVLENSLTVTSSLPSGKTVEQELRALGIFIETTVDIDSYENA